MGEIAARKYITNHWNKTNKTNRLGVVGSMLSWLRARMGNCLNSQTADDVSLLSGGQNNTGSTEQLEVQPQYVQESSNQAPIYYPSPNVSRPASQLTEEEQVKIAQRIGLIQHLPTGTFDGCKKNRECVICMIEFNIGDAIRYLPCMHTYHTDCIDDWLMRSFTCPSCMEPVDAALLVAYDSNWRDCVMWKCWLIF